MSPLLWAFFLFAPMWGMVLEGALREGFPGLPWSGLSPWIGASAGIVLAIIGGWSMQRRMLRVYAARKGPSVPDPYPGTLDIHADFRFDLVRYETGEISLGQFLDRWAGRVPPKRKDKNPGVRMVDATEDQAKTLMGMLVNTALSATIRFKPGQWVRWTGDSGNVLRRGQLLRLVELVDPCHSDIWTVSTEAKTGPVLHASNVEPAFPKEGEWWIKGDCPKVHRLTGSLVWGKGPKLWGYDDQDPNVREAVECGCLKPYNWGKGI